MWLQLSISSLTEVDKVSFNCLPVRDDTPWCSETLTLMCLKVLPIYKALQLPQVKLLIWQERSSSGATSLKVK